MSISVIIPVGHKDQDFKLIDQIKDKFSNFEIIDDEKINTFLLKFDDEKLKYNSIGANLRTKYLKLPFGDQSFIIEKKLFNFLGGFTEGLDKGEDHEFIWKSKTVGIKINIIENSLDFQINSWSSPLS